MSIPLIYADSISKQAKSVAEVAEDNNLEFTLGWLKKEWKTLINAVEVTNTATPNNKYDDGSSFELECIQAKHKLTQKERKQISLDHAQPVLILDEKLTLTLVVDQISVSPDWKSLQRRVVNAGRKSELLLQACKINDSHKVLDATAGFGHDSLILASTGAQVTMLERHPLMALLLKYEQYQMSKVKNWQKLMSRLRIKCVDASQYLNQDLTQYINKINQLESEDQSKLSYDVIYLDPMFPDSSYAHSDNKGAKVGKHMQALHHIAQPPSIEDEQQLLHLALGRIDTNGRVIVKRPVSAPVFANKEPDTSWQNDVVRFDAYLNTFK